MDHVIALATGVHPFLHLRNRRHRSGVSREAEFLADLSRQVSNFSAARPFFLPLLFSLSLSLSSLSRSLPFVGEIALGTRIKNKSRRNYLYGLVTSLLSSRQFISSDVFTLGFVELRSSTSARDSFPILPESLLSKKCAR